MILYSHKKGIVIQPCLVVPAEFLEFRSVLMMAAAVSQAKQGITVFIHLAVIHISGMAAPVSLLAFPLLKESFLTKCFQIYKIRIARKG